MSGDANGTDADDDFDIPVYGGNDADDDGNNDKRGETGDGDGVGMGVGDGDANDDFDIPIVGPSVGGSSSGERSVTSEGPSAGDRTVADGTAGVETDSGDGLGGDLDIPVYGGESAAGGEPATTDLREPIAVGVADYAVSTDGSPLRTSGLGSCLAVVVHDERAEVGGLLHSMLPRSTESNARHHPDGKFADTGIDALLSDMQAQGADPTRCWSKLIGGAKMLEFSSSDRAVGDRNVDAARELLDERNVSIVATDLGGTAGRSIEFDPLTGTVSITTADDRTLEL